MRALLASVLIAFTVCAQAPIRWLDLDTDAARQAGVQKITVRQVAGRYLGHPTTLLLPGGKTMLCVHPEGHGKGSIKLQRSDDAGLTWSEPLPVPESWATSKETPTIHRLLDPKDGTARLVLFSGLYPIRSSVSLDDGATWTELAPIGKFGGIVAMGSVVKLANGDYAAYFHDDGRFFKDGKKRTHFTVYQTNSSDGGLTWKDPSIVWTGKDVDLCEPGVIRSPDGKRLAMLLRENSRTKNSHVMFSDDESKTWSNAVELPRSLTGDRHTGAYAPDGRLFVSFRDMAKGSPTRGDWVAWVGTFDDIVRGREGQYRVRLSRNWKGTDCAYPGVDVLEDGTFVTTTYGHWQPGAQPFIRSIRLQLSQLDALADGPAATLTREPGTVYPTPRPSAWWTKRVASDLALAKKGGHQLVMLGDSITQSWGGPGKKVWQEFWVERNAINIGVSGDRTQHVLWRLDNGLLDALSQPNNDVRCVVVMIGTNNSNRNDCTATEIGYGIEAIVRRLRTRLPKAKVLLLATFPRGAKPSAQRIKNARSSAQAAKAFADDDMVVFQDIGARFLEADGTLRKAVMPDLLHLNAASYRVWAQAIVADVDRLMKR